MNTKILKLCSVFKGFRGTRWLKCSNGGRLVRVGWRGKFIKRTCGHGNPLRARVCMRVCVPWYPARARTNHCAKNYGNVFCFRSFQYLFPVCEICPVPCLQISCFIIYIMLNRIVKQVSILGIFLCVCVHVYAQLYRKNTWR